jgi:hypothetical protein
MGYIPRNTLSESYGEGQRQYDMASAAMFAIEKVAPLFASFAGCSAYLKWGWIAGILAAAAAWWLFLMPYKNALKVATERWDAERAAYAEYLASTHDE